MQNETPNMAEACGATRGRRHAAVVNLHKFLLGIVTLQIYGVLFGCRPNQVWIA
jgi:hypothetical protein